MANWVVWFYRKGRKDRLICRTFLLGDNCDSFLLLYSNYIIAWSIPYHFAVFCTLHFTATTQCSQMIAAIEQNSLRAGDKGICMLQWSFIRGAGLFT